MTAKIRALKPVKSRVVSADEYLVIVESRKSNNIESSRFIPPKIGGSGFGKFKVTFKDKELVDA
jgi:hypothetical protein